MLVTYAVFCALDVGVLEEVCSLDTKNEARLAMPRQPMIRVGP